MDTLALRVLRRGPGLNPAATRSNRTKLPDGGARDRFARSTCMVKGALNGKAGSKTEGGSRSGTSRAPIAYPTALNKLVKQPDWRRVRRPGGRNRQPDAAAGPSPSSPSRPAPARIIGGGSCNGCEPAHQRPTAAATAPATPCVAPPPTPFLPIRMVRNCGGGLLYPAASAGLVARPTRPCSSSSRVALGRAHSADR